MFMATSFFAKALLILLLPNKVLPWPYNVVQSPDKQIISLVQAMEFKGERVKISSVVINNQLQITGDQNYTLPFDSELLDMYLPLVNNQQISIRLLISLNRTSHERKILLARCRQGLL